MCAKFILGLGNPGRRYDATRHNVGWWAVDRLAYDWDFGSFALLGPALVAVGERSGRPVTLVKPATYMNKSGIALHALDLDEEFDPSHDLMVVADDVALAPGRIRLRARGGAGGHKGLHSVSQVLGSTEFHRLRIGVGEKPPEGSLSDWVLSEMPEAEEDAVVSLLPEIGPALETWMSGDTEGAMNLLNR